MDTNQRPHHNSPILIQIRVYENHNNAGLQTKNNYYEQLQKVADKTPHHILLLVGDYNALPGKSLAKENESWENTAYNLKEKEMTLEKSTFLRPKRSKLVISESMMSIFTHGPRITEKENSNDCSSIQES